MISKDATSYQLNTPFNNPAIEKPTEIKVTDPTHPLYGCSFPVLSISSARRNPPHVFVSYHGNMVLRIPLMATNLVSSRQTSRLKLTLESLTELISLAENWEGISCHINQRKSGTDCPQNCKNKSPTNYRQSYRR